MRSPKQLAPDEVREIRRLSLRGCSHCRCHASAKDLAERFDLSTSSVSRIVNGLARIEIGDDPADDPAPMEDEPEEPHDLDPLDRPGPTPQPVRMADFTKAQAEQIGRLLADVFGDEPLTRHVGGELQRIGEQGAWLRESGYSWRTIGSRLDVEPEFAARAVAAVAPELADPAVLNYYTDRVCPICEGRVPLPRWRKPRVYCSDRCQRQAYNFRARCRDCGAPCRRQWCQRCSNRRVAANRKKWHRDAVLAVLVEWIEEHGHPPTYAEWVATHMNPGGNIVQREFGSWSAGVAAAVAEHAHSELALAA